MQKIIIDTDPGIDDAIAILLALSARKELEVLALTTVNGNVGLDKVTKNAFKILEIAGRNDIPVYKGSAEPLVRVHEHCEAFHGDDGLGNLQMAESQRMPEEEDAVDYLTRKVREDKGNITLVPIGPLTNIAKAIQKDPEFIHNVKEVVIMGGAENGGNMTPHAEFNFWMDPEAAQIVFQAGFEKVTMIGLDATRDVWLNSDLRELLWQINTPASRFIHQITRVYVDGHWNYAKEIGCELCDVLIVTYLLNHDIVKTKEAFVDVETEGLCQGASVVYPTFIYKDKKKNCLVATGADKKLFFETFFHYLFPGYEDIVKQYNV